MATIQTADDIFGVASLIVDPTAGSGTHTTIAAALTAASSGQTIFIRPGTFTENLSLKAGVNLTAFDCDAFTPNVIILGKCSYTGTGTVSISGIQLKTNSDFCLAVTGSAASIVILKNCYIYANNNTAISHTTANAGSLVRLIDCFGNTGTTGVTHFVCTSTGAFQLLFCDMENDGGSTTQSTVSACVLLIESTRFTLPIASSSTGVIQAIHSYIDGNGTTAITHNATGSVASANNCYIVAGSASAISVGAGATFLASLCSIYSTNTNAITGSGTIQYYALAFTNTSSLINTTTQTGGSIQGITDGLAPSAKFLGEQITSVVSNVSAGSTGNGKSLTSITLTAGVWDITAIASGTTASSNLSLIEVGISTTTNTFQGVIGDQTTATQGTAIFAFLAGVIPAFRVVISTSTTYYLVGRVDYLAGSPLFNGRISAVRVG